MADPITPVVTMFVSGVHVVYQTDGMAEMNILPLIRYMDGCFCHFLPIPPFFIKSNIPTFQNYLGILISFLIF